MNDNQIYVKLIAFLGNKADAIVSQAQSTLRTTHGFTEDSESWVSKVKRDTFIQSLFVGLIACIFISAWRIISTVMQGEPAYFAFLAFATVIAETINEAVMVFRFSLTSEHLQEKRTKFHHFSIMGILRFISHLVFGRELPILYYLLFYLIVVGIAFNLEYELGLIGLWEKLYHVLFALLPIIGIAVLSHYLGVKVREAKAHDKGQFSALWEAEKLNWLLDTLEAKAAGGTAYAIKALEFYHHLTSEPAISSYSANSGNGLQQAGFAKLYLQNNAERREETDGSGKRESFRSDDLDKARRVLEAYPDIALDARGWSNRISEVAGVSVGRPTTRILEAMKHLSQDGE